MDKLVKIIDEGWNVHITWEGRRMSLTGNDYDRDFYARACWKAERYSKRKDKNIRKESRWEGFSTPTQCVNDMYKKLMPRKKK